jgi:hypothetical protein
LSVETVHNAIINTYRNDATLRAAFSKTLTGTLSSTGTAVTGAGTAFDTEVAVGDYIGTATKGYRKVETITDALHLVVESAFDSVLASDIAINIYIRKGMNKNVSLTKVGKFLAVIFNAATDNPEQSGAPVGSKIRAYYQFTVAALFYDPEDESAESRKSYYDKLIKDATEKNLTFGGVCIGITRMGPTAIVEHEDVDGIYATVMPLFCAKDEIAGNR